MKSQIELRQAVVRAKAALFAKGAEDCTGGGTADDDAAAAGRKGKKTLLERVGEFDQGNEADGHTIAHFPPQLKAIACKPIFFDTAWKCLDFPDLSEDSVMPSKKKKDTKAAEAPLEDLSQDARYEIKIYVPSTQGDSDISDADFEDRILFVQTALSTLFGGYTSVNADGGYIGASSELTSEPVGVVSTWATPEDYEEHLPKLEELLMYCRELWGQETLGFEFENDLF